MRRTGSGPRACPASPRARCAGSPANGAARRTSSSISSTVTVSSATHRDDLLGEDVERVARVAHRLDRAVAHALGDDGALHEIAAELREDHAAAHRADLVTGTTDPLQPGRDRRRRLDLDDEVHRAHVDAELQADDVATTAGSRPALRSSSTRRAARATPTRGARVRRSPRRSARPAPDCAIISAGGSRRPPAGGPAAPRRSAASSLRRAVSRSASRREFANTIVDRCDSTRSSDPFLDVRPDARRAGPAPAAGPVRSSVELAEFGHVLDGDDHLEVERSS